MDHPFLIRKLEKRDRPWAADYIGRYWGSSSQIISRRKLYSVDSLDGYVAVKDNEYVGLITVIIENGECQILTLNADIENIGIGTALLMRAVEYATFHKCKRIWLITTNDNTPALRFYQTRGFVLKAIYCNEMNYSRKIKPEIPLYGIDSIPIRDEIELERRLSK